MCMCLYIFWLVVLFVFFGLKIDKYVAREIINQKSLHHPNVIQFKEVRACVPIFLLMNTYIYIYIYLGFVWVYMAKFEY